MKKKTDKKFYVSMRGFIRASIIILILAVITFIIALMINLIGRSESRNLIDTTMENAMKLSEEVGEIGISNITGNERIQYETGAIASLYNGRVIIVSRDYRIIRDTFSNKTEKGDKNYGTYIISGDVMDVMTQKKESKNFIAGSVAQVMYPVKDQNGDVTGVVILTSSIKRIEKVYKDIAEKLIAVAAVLVILSILAAIWISKVSVKDIDNIAKQIRQASDGNLDTQIKERGFRETRYLVRNYNAVLSKLASADSSRQEFVSNVSHELKTPIASMKVLAESILGNENTSVDDYREFMTDIVAEIDRETTTINDLLILVKTDKQNTVMNFKPANINELIDVILKRVTPLAENRGIRLTYESYKDVVADVDSVKFSIAISNLVENAVKYNVDNGWIKISLNADHKYFYVKVADSGVGIPDDAKDKVFDKFYRVDKARSRDTGGTGLGLSISRNVVNAHGGTIRLYSESGKGTTFTVRIPIKHETPVDQGRPKNKKNDDQEKSGSKNKHGKTDDQEKSGSKNKHGKTDDQEKSGSKNKQSITTALMMLVMAFSLMGCSMGERVKDTVSVGLEEEIRSSDGNKIKIYYSDGESLVSKEDKYQLKQPDNVSVSIEEVMSQIEFPQTMSYSGYIMTSKNTVSLSFTADESLSKEELLLNKAAVVNSLSQIRNIGDIVITVNTMNGGDIETATYTDASFYYYGN